jgi:hypothetical protein
MAISTNSIIHYTKSFEILSLILREGFRIKYCAEVLKFGKTKNSRAAHPMISFCDIPLSDSSQHFDAYGKYGLGLTKEWAVRNGVNPVLYIDKDSLIAESIYSLINERRRSDTNLTAEQRREILQIKSYAKNYKGTLIRNGKPDIMNYVFYNEREWRLIPPKDKINNSLFSINLKNYDKDKEKYNNKLDNCRYTFDIQDISYIIVEKTDEIPAMVKILRDLHYDKVSGNKLDILLSKICSTEQILSDY